VTIPAGASTVIDPRQRALPENTQFAVKATSAAQIASIVMEVNYSEGDGAMAYEGFAQ